MRRYWVVSRTLKYRMSTKHQYSVDVVDVPRGPKKTEGPSILSFEGFGERSKEGFTSSKDTWVCSITAGEKYDSDTSNTDVKDRIGAR